MSAQHGVVHVELSGVTWCGLWVEDVRFVTDSWDKATCLRCIRSAGANGVCVFKRRGEAV